jgi:hypothetical protein
LPLGTFTGGWLQNAYTVGDQALHTADPAHGVTDTTSDESWTYNAPTMQETADYDLYPGEEWVVQTGGGAVLADQDHTEGAPSAVQATDLAYIDQAMPSHESDDLTTLVTNTSNAGPLAFYDERGDFPRVQVNMLTAVDPVALQRGLNGLPENNPEGYREGYDTQVWIDRRLYKGERYHDHRVVTPNTATAPVNAPPSGNPYGTPFSSLARAITDIAQTAEMRSQPPLPGDAILATQNPVQDVYAADSQWVVG